MSNYSTLWQRFAASFIDSFVIMALANALWVLEYFSKTAAWILVIPTAIVFVGYPIYCHGRFGQTVGKRAMRIRVVRTTGERIGWREAYLRSIGGLFFSVFSVIGSFVALATIAATDYYGVGWLKHLQNLVACQPAWLAWTTPASQILLSSDVVVILFNKRRRALHDFIAGTVVIAEPKIPVAQTDTA